MNCEEFDAWVLSLTCASLYSMRALTAVVWVRRIFFWASSNFHSYLYLSQRNIENRISVSSKSNVESVLCLSHLQHNRSFFYNKRTESCVVLNTTTQSNTILGPIELGRKQKLLLTKCTSHNFLRSPTKLAQTASVKKLLKKWMDSLEKIAQFLSKGWVMGQPAVQ